MDEISVEVLQEHAIELWEKFVKGDPDLLDSLCKCCYEKRILVTKILLANKEHQRAQG